MPAQLSPSAVSRDSVIVELRNRTSISPDCKAVNRDCAVSGTYRVLVASPNMAAAIALHRSTSRPVHTPALSGIEKPTSPVLTPQITAPRAFTASNVGPASAGPLIPRTRAATAAARIVHMPRIGPSSLLTIRPPVSGGPSSADRRDGRVHSPAQTIRDLIHVGFAGDERRRQQHVVASPAIDGAAHRIDHQPALERLLLDARGQALRRLERRLGGAVFRQLDGPQQAAAPAGPHL